MANALTISRAQIIYALCLPIAVLMGYFLADPATSGTVLVVSMVVLALSIPILMKWYHPILVLSAQASVTLAMLPGYPDLWLLAAWSGFGFVILNRSTSADAKPLSVLEIERPLYFLAVVVVATAVLNGGLGLRIFGSAQYGAKSYFVLLSGIVSYFTLVSKRIPVEQGRLWGGAFFFSGITAIIPTLIFHLHLPLTFLYSFFPYNPAIDVDTDNAVTLLNIPRVVGLSGTAQGICFTLLAVYGLRGVFEWQKPHRLLLFLGGILGLLFGGYRSAMLGFLLTVAVLFCCEGVFHKRKILLLVALFMAACGVILFHADKLPLVVQRTISFLPARLNPMAQFEASASSDWRLEMWKDVLPDVPKHLLKGKGYAIDVSALNFSETNQLRGYEKPYYWAILTGCYHNGPLSVLIPFGLWGAIGLCWFWIASGKFLYRNYRYGHPTLQKINTFLFVCFIARIIMFCFVVGAFNFDFAFFAGIVGLSISLNGTEPYEAETQTVSEAQELPYNEDIVPEGLSYY